MCEFLMKTTDGTHPNPEIDALQLKAGHVVCIMPDGWKWGSAELNGPVMRVLKVPKLSVDDARTFLERVYDPDDLIALNPHPKMQVIRRFKLPLAAVAAQEATLSADIGSAVQKLAVLNAIAEDYLG